MAKFLSPLAQPLPTPTLTFQEFLDLARKQGYNMVGTPEQEYRRQVLGENIPMVPNTTHSFADGTPEWVKPILIREAERTGVPTILLSAQIKHESGFHQTVGSVAGAKGISQFTAETARKYGLRVDSQVDERTNPDKAIRAQADMMADLLKQHGTVERALSAYNSGNPDRYKDPKFRTWYGSVGETNKYVKKIVKEMGGWKLDLTGVNKKPSLATNIERAIVKPVQAAEIKPLLQPITSFKTYITKKGDTPGSIAQKYLGDWNRWKEVWSGNQYKMPTGVKSNIPQPSIPKTNISQTVNRTISTPAPMPVPTPIKTSPVNYAPVTPRYPITPINTYTVKAGETPSGIAQKLLGDASRWKEIWGGNPYKMPAGAVVKIPTPTVAARR